MESPDVDIDVPASLVRPLTARSVVASTLLGTDPPRLPVSFLVRTGELFGLAEGAVRTALSRMATAGEVTTDGDGWYALRGDLVDRQRRQLASRAARRRDWSGRWRVVVVAASGRPAAERAALRRRLTRERLAELREGVWLRPDNLGPGGTPPGCVTMAATVDEVAEDLRHEDDRDARAREAPESRAATTDALLAARLWDLPGWARTADELRRAMDERVADLEAGRVAALAPGFVVAAAVLRHLLADPLLPDELVPPGWPGAELRADYDRYDVAYRDLLASWTRDGGVTGGHN